jgi:hypothetical protein
MDAPPRLPRHNSAKAACASTNSHRSPAATHHRRHRENSAIIFESMSEASKVPEPIAVPLRNDWELLESTLSGLRPDNVPSLVSARELELVYPLLHALTRGSLGEFYVRVAALESLLADGRSPLQPRDVMELLYWLKEPELVVRTLRESGWMEHEPGGGYRVTESGRFVATMLSFLRGRVREHALMPSVEGVDYMIRCGVDPVRQLILLRSHLEDLRSSMETARLSHSTVILRAAADRLDQALRLSQRIRTILTNVPTDLRDARLVAQDIHDLLSRLHGVGSQLHSAITEVGRQYLNLVAGLSTTDIVTALMALPARELAAATAEALYPITQPPPLLVGELVAAEAEAYLARQIDDVRPADWSDAPPPKDADASGVIPEEVVALLDELDRLFQAGESTTFHKLVPRGTPSESLLRATLLPLLGQQTGGSGVAGRLAALQLCVSIEEDGCPRPAPPPLTELTPGLIEHMTRQSTHG